VSDKPKRAKSATVVVRCFQMSCGIGCGKYGVAGYAIEGRDIKHAHGLPLHAVLPEAFPEGSVVRVTVELLKKGKLTRNPWWWSRTRRKTKP
jgi:3D (Asp-Asp-Asp) domain-containing protein